MKFKSILAILVAAFILSSCLKSKDPSGIYEDKTGSLIIDIPEISYNNYYGQDQEITVKLTPATETIEFFTLEMYATGNSKASNDIKVKLSVTPMTGTGLTALPAGALPNTLEFTIPKSSGKVSVKVPLNKAGMVVGKEYAANFKITEVSEGTVSAIGRNIPVYIIVK
jgi:hypothetical protein